MSNHKVILWGAGGVGEYVLRYLQTQPELELIGVRAYSAEKEGKDVAELVGLPPSGVTATQNVDELLALGADCVIFTPRTSMTDHTAPGSPDAPVLAEALRILESGANLVSSIGSPMHWRQLVNGAAFHEQLNSACQRGNSSVLFTGIDPGFSDCVLGATVASMVGEITQIRSWEMLDYSTYMVAETLAALGFGVKPEEMTAHPEILTATWGGSLWVLADACGVTLDDIETGGDIWVSPETYTVENGMVVQAGTVGAVRWSLSGIVDGEARVQTNHVNRLGAHAAPDWPSIGDAGGYRIEVDGFPSIRGDFPFGLEGGTKDGLKDAMAMTAARLVNSIGHVVEAEPGHLTPNDLPIIGPRYGLANRRVTAPAR
jgi:4-hydroxy-tetrahydrodipicolinate reductase